MKDTAESTIGQGPEESSDSVDKKTINEEESGNGQAGDPLSHFFSFLRAQGKRHGPIPASARFAFQGLLVFAGMAVIILLFGRDVMAGPAIVIMALFAAIIVYSADRNKRLVGVVIFLMFGVGSSWMFQPKGAQVSVDPKPVDPYSTELSTQVVLRGTIFYDTTLIPIPNARVWVEANLEEDTTSEGGVFELTTQTADIGPDSGVTFFVKESGPPLPVRGKIEQGRIRLHPKIPVPAQRIAHLAKTENTAAAHAQTNGYVRVIIDSVRTVIDGTAGASNWRFLIMIGRNDTVRVNRAGYVDKPRQNVALLRTEQVVTMSGSDTLWIRIQGKRFRLFDSRFAWGARPVIPTLLSPDSIYRFKMPVAVEEDSTAGLFHFYFTVRRVEDDSRASSRPSLNRPKEGRRQGVESGYGTRRAQIRSPILERLGAGV